MLDEMIVVRYEKLRNNKTGLWFSGFGKVKYDESDKHDVELKIKNDTDELFKCIINDRKFKDLKVAISTDWNSLEKIAGPAYDKYLSDNENKFYKESKFKCARYCRLIEFI